MTEMIEASEASSIALPATGGARNCPLCRTDNGGQPAAPWSQQDWRLKQCSCCGFLYLENPPPAGDFTTEFAWERTHAEERERRRRQAPVLVGLNELRVSIAARLVQARRGGKMIRWIQRYIGHGRLMDVGCGHGLLFSLLPPQIAPFGVEISRQLAAQADRAAQSRGGRVVEGPATCALDTFADDFFDGIVMRSYLEHEVDPARSLEIARRILRPGGALIVKVPNFDCWNRRFVRKARWCGFRFPDHVNYFTPRSLVQLIEKHGFRVGRFRLTDRLPSGDNMWLMARKAADPLVHGPLHVRR